MKGRFAILAIEAILCVLASIVVARNEFGSHRGGLLI